MTTRDRCSPQSQRYQRGTPRSGYRGSDLVPWHELTGRRMAASPSALRGSSAVRLIKYTP